MGKQSDTHIQGINTDLGKVVTAIDGMNTASDSFSKIWNAMMVAYDTKGGRSASIPIAGGLKAPLAAHEAALAAAKAAEASASQKIAAFDAFVTQKSKTLNPLYKKSLGKSKKFLVGAKDQLADLGKKLPAKSGLRDAYDIGAKYYY